MSEKGTSVGGRWGGASPRGRRLLGGNARIWVEYGADQDAGIRGRRGE